MVSPRTQKTIVIDSSCRATTKVTTVHHPQQPVETEICLPALAPESEVPIVKEMQGPANMDEILATTSADNSHSQMSAQDSYDDPDNDLIRFQLRKKRNLPNSARPQNIQADRSFNVVFDNRTRSHNVVTEPEDDAIGEEKRRVLLRIPSFDKDMERNNSSLSAKTPANSIIIFHTAESAAAAAEAGECGLRRGRRKQRMSQSEPSASNAHAMNKNNNSSLDDSTCFFDSFEDNRQMLMKAIPANSSFRNLFDFEPEAVSAKGPQRTRSSDGLLSNSMRFGKRVAALERSDAKSSRMNSILERSDRVSSSLHQLSNARQGTRINPIKIISKRKERMMTLKQQQEKAQHVTAASKPPMHPTRRGNLVVDASPMKAARRPVEYAPPKPLDLSKTLPTLPNLMADAQATESRAGFKRTPSRGNFWRSVSSSETSSPSTGREPPRSPLARRMSLNLKSYISSAAGVSNDINAGIRGCDMNCCPISPRNKGNDANMNILQRLQDSLRHNGTHNNAVPRNGSPEPSTKRRQSFSGGAFFQKPVQDSPVVGKNRSSVALSNNTASSSSNSSKSNNGHYQHNLASTLRSLKAEVHKGAIFKRNSHQIPVATN